MGIKTALKILFGIFISLLLTNCQSSDQPISTASSSGFTISENSALVTMKMTNEEEQSLMTDSDQDYFDNDGVPPSEDSTGSDPNDSGEQPASDGQDSVDSGEPPADDEQDSHSEDELADEDESGVEEGPLNSICVLKGPGKSVRLGLIENSLAEHGSTPQVVCMSQLACEEQVSRAFEVKVAAKRGFCPDKNPHVYGLTYSQIKQLIDISLNE